MGLFEMLASNAGPVDLNAMRDEIRPIFAQDERLDSAFKFVRDLVIFTNKRIIIIEQQDMARISSIPYESIARFAYEVSRTFDRVAYLKLWVLGESEAISLPFTKEVDNQFLQAKLAEYAL